MDKSARYAIDTAGLTHRQLELNGKEGPVDVWSVAPCTLRDNAASDRTLEKVGMRANEQDDETRSWGLEQATWAKRKS